MLPIKILSRLTQSLIVFITLLAITGVALELMKITIVLDGNRPVLVDHIKAFTGRDVRIDGEVRLTVSFSPRLLVQQLHLSDIQGFANDHQDFLSISEVSIEVPLLPLLSGQLHLRDIAADQARVNLVQRADGNHSWVFNSTSIPEKPPDQTATATDRSSDMQLSIGILQLTDVTLTYSDASRDQVIKEQIDKLVIDVRDRENKRRYPEPSLQHDV
jgi:AsmA protein